GLSGTLTGGDIDASDVLSYGISGGTPNGDGTVSVVGTYGTLTVDTSTGAYSYAKNGVAIESLNVGDAPNDAFTITVTDSQGASAQRQFIVTIVGANDAPVGIDDSATVDEDGTLTIDAASGVLANDSDVDDSSLAVSAVDGLPAAVGQPV